MCLNSQSSFGDATESDMFYSTRADITTPGIFGYGLHTNGVELSGTSGVDQFYHEEAAVGKPSQNSSTAGKHQCQQSDPFHFAIDVVRSLFDSMFMKKKVVHVAQRSHFER